MSHFIRKFWSLIFLLTFSVFLSGCDTLEEMAVEKPKTVELVTITAGIPEGLTVHKTSTLKPESEVQIVSEGAGKVIEIFFEEGDKVQKGQVLARLGEAVSNTQDQINQSQAATALQNARQAFDSIKKQAEENIRQAEISLENAQLAYQNALNTQETTENSLQESEKSARLAIETAELSLKNTKDSSSQSIESAYENALTTINPSLTTAQNVLRDLNNILAVEDENPDVNKAYRDYLGALDPQAIADAQSQYRIAKSLQIDKLGDNVSRNKINSALSLAEDYLEAVNIALDKSDFLLKNTLVSPQLSQVEINGLRSTLAGHVSSVSSSLSGIKQIRQTIESTGITNSTSLDSTEKALESAKQQLSATLASNRTSRQNLEYSVQSAERNLRNVESALTNTKEGARSSIINAENAINSAEQQYNLSTLARNNITIKAPTNGQITKRYIDPGVLVSAGAQIATIANLDKLELDINYTYSESLYLNNQGPVNIFIDDSDEKNPIAAEITQVAPTANPTTHQIAVEVTVDNSEGLLKPNLLAEIKIPFHPEFFAKKILLPLRAVRIGQDQNSVLVIRGGQVASFKVEIGEVYGEYIEAFGLDPGQEIIAKVDNLQIGEKVIAGSD